MGLKITAIGLILFSLTAWVPAIPVTLVALVLIVGCVGILAGY